MYALAKTGPGPGALALVERAVPSIGADDVLIRVVACGICGSDLAIHDAEGTHYATSFPQWLGHEYAGVVEGVGSDVAAIAPGDRVVVEPSSSCGACAACQAGSTNVCSDRVFHGGGFAEYVAASQDRVHLLPTALPWEAAALAEPLACAVHAVHEVAHVQPGDRCAVLGAGPIGMSVALTIRAAGAHPIILARPGRATTRIELARGLGLDVVEASTTEEVHVRLRDDAWKVGSAVTFDCAGGDSALATGLAITSTKGQLIEVAIANASVAIDLDSVVKRELAVRGAVSHTRSAWTKVLDALGTQTLPWHDLVRMVTDVFPLERWREAFDLALGRTRGKILIAPWNDTSEAAP